jgi:hypothetical protein
MAKIRKSRRRLMTGTRRLSDLWFGHHSSRWAICLLEGLEERPLLPLASVGPGSRAGQAGPVEARGVASPSVRRRGKRPGAFWPNLEG